VPTLMREEPIYEALRKHMLRGNRVRLGKLFFLRNLVDALSVPPAKTDEKSKRPAAATRELECSDRKRLLLHRR